jgi:uncharacterized damage-inducible protein DinB
MSTPFHHFYLRDLDKFIAEIEAYPTEQSLWLTQGSIANSAGTLALHIAGNLQHFIGALIGGTGYERNREYEFSAQGLPRAELISGLQTARIVVDQVLSAMTETDLNRKIPEGNHHFGPDATLIQGLIHLHAHLAYHLGQVNYLRRALGQMPE